jgi:hypothetical protein
MRRRKLTENLNGRRLTLRRPQMHPQGAKQANHDWKLLDLLTCHSIPCELVDSQ